MLDYSLYNNEDEDGLGEGIVLKKTRAKSKGGMVTDTVQPGQSVLPNARASLTGPMAYRQRAADLYQQGGDMYQKYLDKSESGGEGAMLNALAAQYAGESFQPLQTQLLKKAMGAEDTQAKRAEFLLQQAKAYETLAQTAETREQQQAYRRQQDEVLNEFRRIGLGIQGMNAQTARMNAGSAPGTGKAPAGYQWTTGQDGAPALTFIPGGPGDPKVKAQGGQPSEDERKAAGWFFQADNARRNMANVIAKNPAAAYPTLTERVVGVTPIFGEDIANSMRTEDRQKFVQAASSMSEALLRAATGAGVNESEARQKAAELTPQLGDKPGTVKQKMDAYDMYMKSLSSRAGRALPGAQTPEANDDPLGLRKGR